MRTIEPDSIEKVFCEPFQKLRTYALDKETTEILLKLLISEPKLIPEKEQPFLFKVITKRIEHCFTFKMTDTRAVLFLSYVAKNPGTALMYLTHIQYYAKKHNIADVDLDDLCHIFPMGFPCEEDLSNLWRNQKVYTESGSDNLLDHSDAMISIL